MIWRGIAAAALAAWTLGATMAQAEELRLLGEYRLPAGISIGGVELGGFSAIEYDAERGVFLLLSDDPAERAPPRYYEAALALSGEGIAGLDIQRSVTIRTQASLPFAEGDLGPTALRLAPDGGGAALYWANETNAEGAPFAGVLSRSGHALGDFAQPGYYAPDAAGRGGVREGGGYEGLAVAENGQAALALGQALRQDGAAPGLEAGSPTRILMVDAQDGLPKAEHVYPVGPIAARPTPADGAAINALVEITAAPGGGLYALERSYSEGQGYSARLYRTGFDGAGNALGVARLADAELAPMSKTLLLTLQSGGPVARVENLEGMTLGPEINGRPTLILISDNDFGAEGSATQILAFAIER